MRFTSSLYLIPLAVLSACGNGKFYSGPAGTLDASTAGSVKSQLATASTVSFTKPGEVTAPARASIPSSCFTKSPDPEVDADGDGIGLATTFTFNCSNAASGGSNYTMAGTFKEVDKNDTAGSNHDGGWRFNLDYTMTLAAARASNGTFTLKGFFDLTKSATTYTYASDFQTVFAGTASPDRASYSLTFGSTWNHIITPDDMATPKAKGSIAFSGFWGYKVVVSARADANQELVLQGSSEGLKYDAACANFYKEGTITFKAASGTMTMTYGCDTATVVKFDGTVI